jgi:NAD(P)H-nitrite reductase large subunit
LRETGITLNQGVRVDEHMAAGLPGIYAAGDVAEPFDPVRGAEGGNAIWPLAVEGGRVAGANMASEGSASLPPVIRMNAVEVLGTRAVSAGIWGGEQELNYLAKGGSVYRKLAFTGNRLSGFLLAGDIRGAGVLTSLIKTRTEISPSILEEGLERGFSYSPRLQALGGEVQVRGTVETGR